MLTVVIATLTFSVTTILSCPSSPDITHIPNFRLCNDSDLSILFNVSDSCDSVSNLHLYVYNHNSSAGGSAIFISHQYLNYGDQLCGVNATLTERVKIDDKKFSHRSLLQIRLKELGSGDTVETCSNNFYLFIDYTGFLGPPVNIRSNIYNCSTINVTWSEPDVNCANPVNYNLSIYDDITDQFLRSVSLYDTSYQFKDEELFRHRYTFVISTNNDFSEGISINDTFSYQRVPKSAVESTTLDVLNYIQDMATIEYNIPVEIQCIGEAPENATVTIECNGTGIVVNDTELIKYEQPNNITGLISVPQYQQCNLSVTFSNEAGSSEPFILTIDTTPPLPPYITSSLPTVSVTPTSGSVTTMAMEAIIAIAVGCSIAAAVIVVLIVVLVAVLIYCKRRKDHTGSSTLSTGNDPAKSSINIELTRQAAVENDRLGEEEVVSDGGAGQIDAVKGVVQNFDVEIEEVVQNNGAEQEVEQNSTTEQEQDDTTKEDTTVAQEDGHDVKQGIAIRAEVHVLTDDSDTTVSLTQNPVPEPKEVARNDMTEKETADGILVDNDDTTTSKSNDKEIESADNASDSKKPSKDKYHKDTYNPRRQLLDPSSSVAEPYVDHSEYSAYYDVPEVPDEAGHKETETTDDDQQQPRQFVTISIPRPTAGFAIISGTLAVLPKENEPQTSPQEILSSTKKSSAPQQPLK